MISRIFLAAALALASPIFCSADDKDGHKHDPVDLANNYAPKGNFLRQPYLQLATPNSINILWRTPKAIKPQIRYGIDPGNLDKVVRGSAIIARRTKEDGGGVAYTGADGESETPAPLHSAPKGCIQYNAHISGLESDTKYFYAVYDGDTALTEKDTGYYFKTHPEPNKPHDLYFWVVGDSGTGKKRAREVHDAMVDFNKAQGRTLDMYLHVGDMAYTQGKDHEFQGGFFNQYAATLRNTVCWAAMGNHEGATSKGISGVGPYYDAYHTAAKAEAGGVASGKESYYSYDFGHVHFIVLDSHDLDRRPAGAMAQWIQADLEKTKAQWLVAYFHHSTLR